MESPPELPREEGIALVLPEDNLNVYPGYFISREIKIPDLGNVYIQGSRENEFVLGEVGIAITESKIELTSADKLDRRGLFELWVGLHGMPPQDNPLVCKILLPKYGLILESTIDLFGNKIYAMI